MSWTRPAALRAQVQKLWERGDLLASVVTGEPLFPRRLTLRGPSSQEMTDSFAEVRAHFAHVESFRRDRATLLACEAHWGEEDRQTLRELPRLNAEEGALYNDLRDNRLGRNLRLEQERIGFGRVEAALAALA